MSSRARQRFLLFALAAATCGAGCRQVLGLHERAEEAPDAGNAPGASVACAACTDRSCASEVDACKRDANCGPAANCFFGCADWDSSCRGRCTYIYRWPQAFTRLVACRAGSCRSECGIACGGISYTATGCEACIAEKCCGAAQQCAANASCLDLDTCNTNNCLLGMNTCAQQCTEAHADGVAAFGDWTTCLNTCAVACRGGNSWECLDAPGYWPWPAVPGDIDISFGLVDLGAEQPFVGTRVRTCNEADYNCVTPIDSQTTDAQGRVTLTASAGNTGFNGFLELQGGMLGGTGSPIFPALWYVNPPYVTGGWKGNLQFLASDSLAQIAGYMGAELDPSQGHLAVDVLDCDYKPAPNVSLTIESGGGDHYTAFYFRGQLPDTSATQTDSETAIGGFVNLAPGQLVVKATRENGTPLGTITVQIRAGAMTASTFPPILK